MIVPWRNRLKSAQPRAGRARTLELAVVTRRAYRSLPFPKLSHLFRPIVRRTPYQVAGLDAPEQAGVKASLPVDMKRLGENTIRIDCDVIQADGGTRTTSITGGYVALCDALQFMVDMDMIDEVPLLGHVAAVSVGVVKGDLLLDLCYIEDAQAEVDMNIVMRNDEFVEVQGTGEGATFARGDLERLLDLAVKGIQELIEAQKKALSR